MQLLCILLFLGSASHADDSLNRAGAEIESSCRSIGEDLNYIRKFAGECGMAGPQVVGKISESPKGAMAVLAKHCGNLRASVANTKKSISESQENFVKGGFGGDDFQEQFVAPISRRVAEEQGSVEFSRKEFQAILSGIEASQSKVDYFFATETPSCKNAKNRMLQSKAKFSDLVKNKIPTLNAALAGQVAAAQFQEATLVELAKRNISAKTPAESPVASAQ